MKKKSSAENKTDSSQSASEKDSRTHSPDKKDFLVVGLGASAGGVKALQEFFALMPPNSGMAFVAILHLSPEHESSLPQIIQAQTQMPVTQVVKTVKVEPNNVYVIPPNAQLEMVDGVIRPSTAERKLGHRIAIDVFFRTLAEAYEKNAVCVVLSGTGSDGTLGLKRIKESNGFAIVQDPEDAEYDAMPRSAIGTQLADWVLPVSRMPEKLIHFKESSERLHLTNGANAEKVAEEIHADESLREILTILRVRTGHDFANYKTPTLVRRIARHIQIHELEDVPAYLEILRQKPDEVQSLLKNLLINVTNFFRDKEAFDALQREVVPKIFEGKTSSDTVRVWSCGCASGEEAYSLAMILQEHADTLPEPPKMQVFASDVDEDALQEAREHRYNESIETDVSPERLKRFFIKEGSFYRVRKELRETMLFAPHNILRDAPFSRLDLIVCRNLLIYLNRTAQETALQVFHFALNSGGFLFLGSSETADGAGQLFAPLDKKQKIYARRSVAAPNYLPTMPAAGRWEVALPVEKAETGRGTRIALGEIHHRLLEDYAPSSVMVNQDFDIVYLSGTAGKFLRYTDGELSNNILKAVHPDLLPDLRAALFTAQRERHYTEFPNVRVTIDGEPRVVNIIVRVVDRTNELKDFLLVVFEERNSPAVLQATDLAELARDKDDATETIMRRLEEDLQRTKEHLRFTLEQHETAMEEAKAANEELQAINEELRSTSEELETSKEKAQSVNEELVTVNHEYKEKIEESARINSDLSNLVASTDIATIFLDKNFRIKRYTPLIEKLFSVTPHDIGRPLEHFTHHLDFEDMTQEAERVLRMLRPSEREVADEKGNTYLARFLPYRTIDDRIEGVVLNFIDITARHQAEKGLREFEGRFRAFVTASSDAVYNMNADWTEMRFLDGKDFFPDTVNPDRDWLEKYILPEDRAQVLLGIKEAVRAKSKFELEHRIIRTDGSPGWAFSRAIPLMNAAGEIVEWFGAASDITDRKATNETLRQSEEKYHTLFDSIGEGFCVVEVVYDRDGQPADHRIVEANRAFETHTGLKNPVGRLASELAPGIEQLWHDAYAEVIATGVAVKFEQHSPAFDRWFEVEIARVGAADEKRVAILFTDISQRKRSEVALRESEERMRIAIEAGELATWEWDILAGRVYWNEQHFKLFGMKPTEKPLKPEDFFYHVYEGDREWVGERLDTAVNKKIPFEAEFRATVENDGIRWMNGYGRVIETDRDGRAARMSGVMFDITKRKRAEEDLRKSEEQLQLILESTRDYAIVTFDLKGFITRWNPGAERIFGYTSEQIVGTHGGVLFTPEDRAAGVPEWEMKTAATEGRAEDERWHLRRDGSRFFADGVMQPLKDDTLQGFVKIARDQTERIEAGTARREKETLQKLVKAQEDERRRIARDLHDELGQQLVALRLKLEAVAQKQADPVLLNQLHEIQNIARSLDDGVDFLAFEIRPTALDDLGLVAALDKYIRQWSHYSDVKAELTVSNLKRARFTSEVETCFYRVVQEALNNTHKHAAATRADIVLERRGETLILIVEDNGKGFDPGNKTSRSKGIGLVGMEERAALIGGSFEIESAPKKGTTIYVRLPFEAAREKQNDGK